MPARRVAAAIVAVALTTAGGGCGPSAGPGTTNAAVTVTRDFGTVAISAYRQSHVPGAETVMQMLKRHFAVSTGNGGGVVQSINGHAGDGARHGWFFYVNGIEAPKGAALTAVHQGDRIWWDLHDRSATDTIPAVVGSFPEPFRSGVSGRRLPTVLACAAPGGSACGVVATALKRAHIPFADQLLGGGSGSDSLAIIVGTWAQLHGVIAAELVASGPAASGVYARFAGRAGTALQLLDPAGRVVAALHAGAGLVAATEEPSIGEPTWLITGTDEAGVSAAASALTPARLRDHFALAVAAGRYLPVPVVGGPVVPSGRSQRLRSIRR